MSQLFQFLARGKNFLLFLFLEAICFWLIVRDNSYWEVSFFNSSNSMVARTMALSTNTNNYFRLNTVNAQLVEENRLLREKMTKFQNGGADANSYQLDSLLRNRFQFTTAKVVNNSIGLEKNYVTIDKGTLDGIEPGMGILSSTGVVGRVKSCSDHYAIAYSILHTGFDVSARVKNKKEIGTVRWNANGSDESEMINMPRYQKIQVGDSIVTSDYNAVFPAEIMIGVVKKVGIKPDMAFHDIKLRLSTDFPNLAYVYVVKNNLKQEQESIEATVKEAK